MKKFFIIVLACTSFAVDEHYLSSWATYRLTEMFDHSYDTELLEKHFSQDAWQEFQVALEKSNIKTHQKNDHYETRISKFIKPVKIISGEENTYYAQSTFIVAFSNNHGSWQQPMELILTINDEQSGISITEFEGKASSPIQVKNFALDRAQACNKR